MKKITVILIISVFTFKLLYSGNVLFENQTKSSVLVLTKQNQEAILKQSYPKLAIEAIAKDSVTHLFFEADFEDNSLNDWYPIDDWVISGDSPLSGSYSLKHEPLITDGISSIASRFFRNGMNYGEMHWKFRLRNGNFDPTTANKFWYYLMASDSLLSAIGTSGYVVGVNFTGSTDSLSLWRIDVSGTKTLLLQSSLNWEPDDSVYIEVIRQVPGSWKLGYQRINTSDVWTYTSEVKDENYADLPYHGLVFQFSSTRAGLLWADDFYFYQVNTAPILLKVDGINSEKVLLTFSEPIDPANALITSNYELSGLSGTIPVDSVSLDASFPEEIILWTTLDKTGDYQISIAGLTDTDGAVMESQEMTFFYSIPAQPGDVVVNEIMSDPIPIVDLPEFEFVELYNRSPDAFQLANWYLKVGDKLKVLDSCLLESGKFLILCESEAISAFATYGSVLGVDGFPALLNSGTTIGLYDTEVQQIDEVYYSSLWYQDAEKDDGGWTLERIDPNNLCSADANWQASNNEQGGTPGMINSVFAPNIDTLIPAVTFFKVLDSLRLYLEFSETMLPELIYQSNNYMLHGATLPVYPVDDSDNKVILQLPAPMVPGSNYTLKVWHLTDLCANSMSDTLLYFTFNNVFPNDLVFTEIMMDESPAVGLPEYEYLEIYNRSNHALQLENWTLTVGTTDKKLNRATIEANQYLILCHSESVEAFSIFGQVMGIDGFQALSNTGTQLQLMDTLHQQICNVSYSSDWYQSSEKDDGGWSLEIIDPENTCSGITNWKVSENPLGGTPGQKNSVYAPNIDDVAPQVFQAYPISSHEIVIVFTEFVSDASALSPTNYFLDEETYPDMVSLDPVIDNKVQLQFADAWNDKDQLFLQVRNIIDPCDNVLSDTVIMLQYYEPRFYDVLINEIMATPTPSAGLPEVEYLEFYNRSDFGIHASDWTITVGSSVRTLPYFYIPAHAYVLVAEKDEAFLLNDFGTVVGVESLPALPSSGRVTLHQKEAFVCSTAWTSDWYASDFKSGGGYSLERIDENNANESNSNWKESDAALGGTPGERNSVYTENPDLDSPFLMRAFPVADSLIRVEFSEPMAGDAFQINYFTLVSEAGIIDTFLISTSDLRFVDLKLNYLLETGVVYTLTVSHEATDLAGNMLQTNTVNLAIPQVAVAYDIVINELLYNPTTGGSDFVELFNRSSKTINLKQCYLASYDEYQNLKQVKSITDALVFPGEFMVLSDNPVWIQHYYYTPNPLAFLTMESLPSYPDDAGSVVLIDTSGNIIDAFIYEDAMQFGLLQSTEGVSLERMNPERPTSENSNWHSAAEAVGWATPGYKNSMFQEAGSYEETISVEPESFSPDNDGYNDVVQFNYHFDTPGVVATVTIFDDKGRQIRRLVNNELLAESGVMVWDGLTDAQQKAPIGIYIVLFEVFDLEGAIRQYKKVCVVNARL